jgi:hypothetical protein
MRSLFVFLFFNCVLIVSGQTSADLSIHDTRSLNLSPSNFSWTSGNAFKVRFDFKELSIVGAPGIGSYSTLMTMPQWGDNSGGKMHQLNFNNGGVFYRQGWPSSSSWENWQKLLIENENGNVGIGTISPFTKLNVFQGAGDNNVGSPAIRVGGTGNYPSLEFGIKGAYDGMISTYGNDLHIYAGNWRYNNVASTENHSISFYTSQIGSTNWNTAKMYLNHYGNLGIGTTNPTERLSVNGNIRAKKLIISQQNWSDYVFAKGYKLRSLAEVENYFKTNQHLPDVPSAKEVVSKGINVGDTQALLLKKIEELTLYVIELKKENMTIKNEFENLKKSLNKKH